MNTQDITVEAENYGKLVITRQGDTTVAFSDDGRVWLRAEYPHGVIWTAEDGQRGMERPDIMRDFVK